MRHTFILSTAALALAFAFSTPSYADDCKISKGQAKMVENGRVGQALFVGASRNTDAGGGNGSEVAFLGIWCESGIEAVDSEFNVDANDAGGFFATDPGNSNQSD